MVFGMRKEPGFIVLGTAKAGTTYLESVLKCHPSIELSTPKETWFFDSLEYEKGVPYYLDTFFEKTEKLTGEVATSYLYVPFVAERIAESTDKTKLVVILRDPIERAYSDWWMMYSRGYDSLSFDEAIEDNMNRIRSGPDFSDPGAWAAHLNDISGAHKLKHRTYIDYGFYSSQLSQLHRLGLGKRILVLQFEKLISIGLPYLDNLYRHLGVDNIIDVEALKFVNRNEALPSRAVGRVINVFHASGLNGLISEKVKNEVKALIGRKKRSIDISPATRNLLTSLYEKELYDLGSQVGKDVIDVDLWPTMING